MSTKVLVFSESPGLAANATVAGDTKNEHLHSEMMRGVAAPRALKDNVGVMCCATCLSSSWPPPITKICS